MLARNLLRHLDLTTLQLLLSVDREGTLTRAARQEAMTVSAASKRLYDLEQAMGTSLFVRKSNGMEPTATGRSMLGHIRRILSVVHNIELELSEQASGFVRVAANLSAIVEFLPEDLQSFLEAHPAVRIDLNQLSSEEVARSVRDGTSDIGICAADSDLQGLQVAAYRTDRWMLVMRPDHPLAARQHAALADTLEHDYIGMPVGSWVNARACRAAREAGRTLRLRMYAPGFDAICRMAQVGMGIGIVPQKVYLAIGKPMGLAAVLLDDGWARRDLTVVVRPDESQPPAMRALLAHLSRQPDADAAAAPGGAGAEPPPRPQTARAGAARGDAIALAARQLTRQPVFAL
ncbi:DNA-binding transcriptional LysR family regulator [Cupriavidus gilardii J11]|uniref:DNA-binding transcriptional LysR family regulator n=1 Tax=Cupriavidus gilardii J11 TaxID=936133 RepID=A0A562BUK3_9BURK|nr:LysR substrate-binding domain-containing protein [Cupriavidus gilardii]TWG88480.1 DNA-binding transcriptional LysR family regulator [Cupriavidus gilardii J11]